ncbi:MAG: leucine-rich repeat protein, partial [Clostridia bacterium]|nr:leucine-rich repeat protein [Clostridia bacterium]
MKRLSIVLLALLLCLSAAWAEQDHEEYVCGDYSYVLLGDGTAEITGYTGREKDVTLPSELDGHVVTAIGERAFSDDDLTSVVIPDSVTEVGIIPFTGEESDAETRVKKSTLTSIHLGSGVTNLIWASNLVGGFYGPAYPGLAVITVSPDNPVYTVEKGLLIDKTTSTVVCCPAAMTGEAIVPDGVTAVGNYAFAKASASYVHIPDSVTSIGSKAFSGARIGRIRLPGGPEMTFAKDFDVLRLFPEAMTDARMQALLEGLTKKEARTIQDAYKQTGVDPATGKSRYRKTDDIAALEAAYPALKEGMVWILLKPDMKSNAIVKLNDAFTAAGYTPADLPLDYELTFGKPYPEEEKLHPLAYRLPYMLVCQELKSLALPKGCELENLQGGLALIWAAQQGYTLVDVTVSGDFAYTLQADGTAEIVGYFGETENLVIPDRLDGHAVTAIGGGAISDIASMVRESTGYNAPPVGGTALKSVHIPAGVVNVGVNPFRGCAQLEKITVAAENPALAVVEGALCRTAEKLIVCYPRARVDATFTLPEDDAEGIGRYAFENCTGLRQLVLPDSLTTIGENAFKGCTGLTEAVLPAGLTTIGKNVFEGCTGLTEVALPDSLTTIGENAFKGCTGLTEVALPDSLTTIGENVFRDCTGLTEVALPEGLTTIGENAFRDCTGLTEVALPEGLTTIGENAFRDCTGLTHVVLPATAFSLADAGLGTVTHVVIPDSMSLTDYSGNPFRMLDQLTTIEVSQEHPTLALIDG